LKSVGFVGFADKKSKCPINSVPLSVRMSDKYAILLFSISYETVLAMRPSCQNVSGDALYYIMSYFTSGLHFLFVFLMIQVEEIPTVALDNRPWLRNDEERGMTCEMCCELSDVNIQHW
jgi:hypothetical protein